MKDPFYNEKEKKALKGKEKNEMISTYKHLSIEERKLIESLLNINDIKLKNVSSQLGRSDKCVRNEIITHRYVVVRGNQHNKCGRQNTCRIQRLCTHCISGLCKGCKHDNCNQLCEDFVDYPVCDRTTRFPYVCSGCKKIDTCKMPKYFYNASRAQSQYERDKTVWREGPKLSEVELKHVSEVLKDGIKKGQSIDVIIHTNNLPISVSTAYRYIEKHYITGIINLDLKRQVSYPIKKANKPIITPINYDFLEGRSFSNFVKLISLEPEVNVWEMDTIIGKKGTDEKCVLSLLHRKSNLQLFFLLNHKHALEVNKIFDLIKAKLGPQLFKELLTIILTDNGSEFHDPLSIEIDPNTGEKLSSVFFCEPRRSDQKAKCEKNHEHFREMVPKGKSMNALSQHQINYVSNMVNNYPRRLFNFHSPLEVASTMLNDEVFSLNKLSPMDHNSIKLKPIV